MCNFPDQGVDSQPRTPSSHEGTDATNSLIAEITAHFWNSHTLARCEVSGADSSIVTSEDVGQSRQQSFHTCVSDILHQAPEYSASQVLPLTRTASTSASEFQARLLRNFDQREQRLKEVEPFAALLVEEAIEDSQKMLCLVQKYDTGQLEMIDLEPDTELIHLRWLFTNYGWYRAVFQAGENMLHREDNRRATSNAEERRQALVSRINRWSGGCIAPQEELSGDATVVLASD